MAGGKRLEKNRCYRRIMLVVGFLVSCGKSQVSLMLDCAASAKLLGPLAAINVRAAVALKSSRSADSNTDLVMFELAYIPKKPYMAYTGS